MLINRGLYIKTEDRHFQKAYVQQELLDKNYFDLINGFEDIFLEKNESIKIYKGKSIYDFIDLYEFDVKLSTVVLEKIEIFEKKLKSRIAYFFSKRYCQGIENTENYINISYYNMPNDKRDRGRVEKHVLFNIDNYGRNFIEQNKGKYEYIGKYDKLPFWVGIKALTLGQVYWISLGLKVEIMYELMDSFGYEKSELSKAMFTNSIYILNTLRNSCAHFEVISRFNTKTNFRINNNLVKKLNLKPKRSNYVISLYDALAILRQFVCIDEIVFKIFDFNDLKIKNNKTWISEYLYRMGRKNIDDWLELLY